jgi:hypothetical protein
METTTVAAIALVVALLLLPSMSVMGTSETVDGVMQIDYDPTSLKLKPDESGEVHFTIKNVGGNGTYVAVWATIMETPGHSDVTVSPASFWLAAGESKDVLVRVTSHARTGQDAGESNFVIDIVWGQDYTGTEVQEPYDGEWEREFEVEDDLSEANMVLYGGIAIIVVVLIVIIASLMMRGRREAPADESPDEP